MKEQRIATLVFFLAGLLTVTFFGGKIIGLYLLLWLGIVIIASIYFQLLPPTLPCTLELPASCAKGQKITGYLHVVQDGRLPIFHGVARIHLKSLYYGQEEDLSLDITLMGEEEGIAAFDMKVPYVGMMEITLEEAEIYGILGLNKKTIVSSLKKYLTVMPDVREMNMEIPDLGNIDPEGEEIRESNQGYDPGMYLGIRPYREGDSLKNIHWKLTGKTNEIMVKELGIPSGKEPRLYLDTRLPDLKPARIDRLVEDFFSFSLRLVDLGRPHILCWKSGGVAAEEYPVENFAMLEELMEPLFHVSFCVTKEAAETNIYYMTHDEKYVYGYYHENEGGYLAPIVPEERLWNEGKQ